MIVCGGETSWQLEVLNDAPVVQCQAETTVGIYDSVSYQVDVTDPEKATIETYWDFNGDGFADDSSKNGLPRYWAFTDTGLYESKIIAVDDQGDSSFCSRIVRVILDPPVFAAVPDSSIQVHQELLWRVQANQKYGRIVSYHWDLDGDGSFEKKTRIPEARQKYDQKGSYKLLVKAVDDDSVWGEASWQIAVFNVPPVIVCQSETTLSILDSLDFQVDVQDSEKGAFRIFWDFDADGIAEDSTSVGSKTQKLWTQKWAFADN